MRSRNISRNIRAFWKFVKGSVKSSKNKIEALIDGYGNSFCSHADKVKILNHIMKSWAL